jgi:hypothetical protein
MPKQAKLEKWEIAIIKAMIEAKQPKTDQDILAYFTRPIRSINHRAVAEIRKDARHKTVKAATSDELQEFLATYPDIDPQTGLSARGDELLLKAREAMIAAVNTFNSLGLMFRAELFIVTSAIAWTYLLHAWFKYKGIDYRYREKGQIKLTKNGAEMYWDLGFCLRHAKCPLPGGTIKNLEFLLELRHEIEHKSTDRIDDAVSSKLQACCINFNDAIQDLFGKQYALHRRLPIALQFVTFDPDQRATLKKASLPQSIETMMKTFHATMRQEEFDDPRFAYRVAFLPKVGNRASSADIAIEFVKEGSEKAKQIAQVLLKEIDKPRYAAGDIVKHMHKESFPKFDMHAHMLLWKALKAKQSPDFGAPGPYKNTWFWFDPWTARVRAHCQENAEKYK